MSSSIRRTLQSHSSTNDSTKLVPDKHQATENTRGKLLKAMREDVVKNSLAEIAKQEEPIERLVKDFLIDPDFTETITTTADARVQITIVQKLTRK